MSTLPEVIYEDNHVLVALKPPGMPTQGDVSGDEDCLSLLKAYIKAKYQKPGEVYLGLVHRLDRPVGGLLVFARTSKAAARLSLQVRERGMGKVYLAVCQGEAPAGELRDYLKKDRLFTARVVQKNTPDAKEAVLESVPLAGADGLWLCRVLLHTGRHHQIRAQFAHHGAPLWGDNRYGSGKPGQTPALWAFRLSFDHPTSGKRLCFFRLPPKEMPWANFDVEALVAQEDD